MRTNFWSLWVAMMMLCLPSGVASAVVQAVKAEHEAATLLSEFTYTYEKQPRKVPVKLYYPKDAGIKNAPVIIMSHGLGGSREIGSYLGETWAQHGFVVVAMQHEGSDREIINGRERGEMMQALKKAISAESYLKRVEDVSATIDQVVKWNIDQAHPLFGKMNPNKIGMCGHSFGAVTTQAVSGQWNPLNGQKFTDQRIKAAFAMSPSIPKKRGKPDVAGAKKAFSKVCIPWLLMTGTEDKAIVTPNVSPESRQEVYKNLPPGDKYQLVLDGAKHMAFSDRPLFARNHRNPDHHKAIKKISTAFFLAYLMNDADSNKANKAKVWLKSDAVRNVLSPEDTWEKK